MTTLAKISRVDVTTAAQVSSAEDSRAKTVKQRVGCTLRQFQINLRLLRTHPRFIDGHQDLGKHLGGWTKDRSGWRDEDATKTRKKINLR